ncbi:hypothetical protein EHYA_05604 [Embleya hyalina]|uniref:Uncharacterized protein n=1 Tax=Embleya hyalina TaxID=516124 RepID=A0A401YTK7_9ACTN|nr:hypothetical protein EHYA_05604 [Embleya hyalina]
MDDVIVRPAETCASHPSQWNARTSDGRCLFPHHRHGISTVERHPDGDPDSSTNDVWETWPPRTVKGWNDRTNDGYVALTDFLAATGLHPASDADVSVDSRRPRR